MIREFKGKRYQLHRPGRAAGGCGCCCFCGTGDCVNFNHQGPDTCFRLSVNARGENWTPVYWTPVPESTDELED